MESLIFSVIQGVSVFFRRLQLAPKFTNGVLAGGRVDRHAKRDPEAFAEAVKVVIY